jgi:hypothetical protein
MSHWPRFYFLLNWTHFLFIYLFKFVIPLKQNTLRWIIFSTLHLRFKQFPVIKWDFNLFHEVTKPKTFLNKVDFVADHCLWRREFFSIFVHLIWVCDFVYSVCYQYGFSSNVNIRFQIKLVKFCFNLFYIVSGQPTVIQPAEFGFTLVTPTKRSMRHLHLNFKIFVHRLV